MIAIDKQLSAADLAGSIDQMWQLSATKLQSLEASSDSAAGSPVFTVDGHYQSQGWTEWTEGFQYGSQVLQYDATDEASFLEAARQNTVQAMASHVTHVGVHDHGFNNISTYGALRRLMREGRIEDDPWQRHFYELALKASGAVQASRWSGTADGDGYIYSFNGPHSLFCDTIRSLRSLAMAHLLGQSLMGENDESICLLDRLVQHARSTARYNVYYGEGRDIYDVAGRVAHESIFNTNDGRYRCPSTQQGYSPFSTWTRGLAWVMCGYPEQLELLNELPDESLESLGGRDAIESMMLRAARASCDFFIQTTPPDGIPYWDTGAPGLAALPDHQQVAADPFDTPEPVDSSAAAIGAQGLLRLGHYLEGRQDESAARYWQAGLTVARTLLAEPYLSTDSDHQGLLLHSIYHRPGGWDHSPAGSNTPHGEACMWGDYHLRELALYLGRIASDGPYYTYYGPL
ncbi:MAG: glycosyl hydrolase [Pirellulaceae bacterium]